MIWRILSIGKPALPFIREGLETYTRRLGRFAEVQWITLRASDPGREETLLLERSAGFPRVVLDERGVSLTSRRLAELVDGWRGGRGRVALLVGGAGGLAPGVRQAADFCWSLSPLTLQHELALLVAAEQIYRAHTLLAGHPYHRD